MTLSLSSAVKELIHTLEQAKEGSRELDRLVRNERESWTNGLPISAEELSTDERLEMFIAPFTTSLDTSLALLDKDWWLDFVGESRFNDGRPNQWCAQIVANDKFFACDKAATGPLALCIAALRARLSSSPTTTEAQKHRSTDTMSDEWKPT
jgi:hypothetical protein